MYIISILIFISNTFFKDDFAPIHLAITRRNVGFTSLLLDNGADPDSMTSDEYIFRKLRLHFILQHGQIVLKLFNS